MQRFEFSSENKYLNIAETDIEHSVSVIIFEYNNITIIYAKR